MKNVKLIISLCFFLMILGITAYAGSKDVYVKATYGTVRTLDTSVVYDTASGMRVANLYETLIYFKGSSTKDYIPVLTTKVPTVENGGISADGLTYTFNIRKGVKFHNGATLTPEDVVYSFKRAMVADPDGGPNWMILEALTGAGGTRSGGKIASGIFDKIDKAIEAKGNDVIFHLPIPYPPLMGILTYQSSSIINKKWATENGAWDGNMANAAKYNNPPANQEPLQKIANGTGAYMLKNWEPSKQFIFERFDGYWGEKPSIKTAIIKYVPEWSTRKLMLQNGDADNVTLDATFVKEVEAMKDVKIYRYPALSVSAAFFNQNINTTGNTDIGSGKLDGNGIPANFFSDVNVRKGFAHAFDSEAYISDVGNNLIVVPSSPLVKGLPYHREDVPRYKFNMKKAEEYLRKAWGGQVWEKGFKMVITHNTGNVLREGAANMIAENVASLNPKFQIEVRNVPWKDYLVKYRSDLYPMFLIGWGADYPDPHNFMYPFMHSKGTYGKHMGIKLQGVDYLIDSGIKNVDPAKREVAYFALQQMWYEHIPGVMIYQPVNLKPYRKNVTGFVPNSMNTPSMEILKDLIKN